MVTRAEEDRASGRGSHASGRRARGLPRGAERHAGEATGATNVNGVERALSVLGGGALALLATRRRDWTAIAYGLAGGALVERGVSGRCGVYGALGLTSAGDSDAREGRVPLERQRGRAATVDASKSVKIERAMTIYGRTPDELFAYWRRLENLPRIFAHLESVTEYDAKRSRWVAKAPAGQTVTWDAEIVHEQAGEIIGWKSLPGARVPNAGSVHFRPAPGDRGTEIRVSLEYEPPAGKVGVAIARLFGEEPAIQVREDLRRYKALMEAGELPVSENPGQGRRAREEFDARVSTGRTGADVRDVQRRATREAHEPQHVPPPGDAQRGANTTQSATAEARR
jgi:uncharacterized membrane protein